MDTLTMRALRPRRPYDEGRARADPLTLVIARNIYRPEALHVSSHPSASRRVATLGSTAIVLVALLGWLVYATAEQLPYGSAVKAGAAVLFLQVLPGAMIWRSVRPRQGWLLEDLTMGFAMGFVIAVPAQTMAGLMHSRLPAIVVPLLVIAIFAGVPVLRRRIVDAQWSRTPWWFGLAISVLSLGAFAQTSAYFKQNLLYSAKPWAPHVDTYLHQALAAQLLHRGPTSWPTVAGEDLGYQWFAHAWVAHVTATSGVPLDHVLIRFLPALMPVVAMACCAVLGLRLSGSSVVGVVTAALSMVGSQGQPFGVAMPNLPITPLSPTLGLGIPTLVALVLVLATRWRGQAQHGAVWLIPVLAVIATGTKGSTSPVVIAGLGLAAVAMLLWNRPLFWPVVRDTAMMIVALLATMVVVFHGSVAGLKLGLGPSARQTPLGLDLKSVTTHQQILFIAVVTVLAALTRAGLAFALPFRRASRMDPVTWLLIGASVAGAVAVGIFSHPGYSQGYFTATAIPLAAAGSALGAHYLWAALGPRRKLLLTGVGFIGAVLFVKLGPWLAGPVGRRTYDRVLTDAWVALAVAAAAALAGAMVMRRRWWRGALVALAAVGLISGVGAFAQSMHKELPVPDPPTATLRSRNAVSSNEIRAARYIRDHSGIHDLVMTNRHCTRPREPRNGCDSRRWLVTAFSERQLLVEGWTATPRASRIAPDGSASITVDYWKPDLLRMNDEFIAAPTAAAQKQLWELGVRWIYVENTRPHASSLAPFATLGLRTPDASAWKLNPPT